MTASKHLLGTENRLNDYKYENMQLKEMPLEVTINPQVHPIHTRIKREMPLEVTITPQDSAPYPHKISGQNIKVTSCENI